MTALLQDGAALGVVLQQASALRTTLSFLRSLALAWRTARAFRSVQSARVEDALASVETCCGLARLAPVLHQIGVRAVAVLCRAQLDREARYARAVPGPLVLERWGHLEQVVSDVAARLEQLLDETDAEIDQLLGRGERGWRLAS